MNKKNLAAIILAGGRGTRIGAQKKNKVMFEIAGRPMIAYTIDLIEELEIKDILVVLGFQAESIKKFLGEQVVYARQEEALGTADAVKKALPQLPKTAESVLVLNGDDSAFYPPEEIRRLIDKHQKMVNQITVLTVEKDEPQGFGRIIRGQQGKIRKIVEEKNASKEEKKIKEVNTACYCFDLSYLKRVLPKVEKNPAAGEYYLTDTVALGLQNGAKIATLKLADQCFFQGVNTEEQLKKANRKMQELVNSN